MPSSLLLIDFKGKRKHDQLPHPTFRKATSEEAEIGGQLSKINDAKSDKMLVLNRCSTS